jgi:hypothetical protein
MFEPRRLERGFPMAIKNDKELRATVAKASGLVQDIQDCCGHALRDEAKINFPRGLIGTADSYRQRCPGYLEANTISSCGMGSCISTSIIPRGLAFRQQLTRIRTVSLRTGVSVSGKPNFVRGDKGDKTSPKNLQRRQ